MDRTDALDRALRYLDAMPLQERLVIRLSLRSLELAGLRHGGRFHRLGPDRRVECLSRLAHSTWYPRRIQYLVLKAICLMSIYSTPEAHRAIGYRPEACLADREVATPAEEAAPAESHP